MFNASGSVSVCLLKASCWLLVCWCVGVLVCWLLVYGFVGLLVGMLVDVLCVGWWMVGGGRWTVAGGWWMVKLWSRSLSRSCVHSRYVPVTDLPYTRAPSYRLPLLNTRFSHCVPCLPLCADVTVTTATTATATATATATTNHKPRLRAQRRQCR